MLVIVTEEHAGTVCGSVQAKGERHNEDIRRC